MIKHNNEDSLVNKHMIEDPGEYKYKCSRHDNCKKYFKTARQTSEFLFRPIVFFLNLVCESLNYVMDGCIFFLFPAIE